MKIVIQINSYTSTAKKLQTFTLHSIVPSVHLAGETCPVLVSLNIPENENKTHAVCILGLLSQGQFHCTMNKNAKENFKQATATTTLQMLNIKNVVFYISWK